VEAQAKLVTSAFSCDLTRVAILHMPGYGAIDSGFGYKPAKGNVGESNYDPSYPAGLGHTDTHDLATNVRRWTQSW